MILMSCQYNKMFESNIGEVSKMYEYNNNEKTEGAGLGQIATEQQLKNVKRQEKKARSKKFWGKVGTAMAVGLVFGVFAAGSFAGVTRAIDFVFPKKIEQKMGGEEKQDKFVFDDTRIKDDAKENAPGKEETDKNPGRPAAKDNPVDTDSNKDDNTAAMPMVARGMDVSEIVDSAMPCIVSITNKSVQEVISMFGMGVQQYESESAGSGIIIGQDEDELLIVTNNHVIDNANSLTVGFVDDEVYPAIVKGTDPDIDIAVLTVKIEDLKEDTKNRIKIASIGDSDALEVGQQVVAIGNALGYGQSVTTGIISAMGRDMTDDNVDNPLLQTDAAINPGNSGGALLNMNGELVGINCAKIASTAIEGVGYAIPMSEAMPVIETLMNRVTREKVDLKDAGYIGITGVSVDSKTSQMYGVPEGVYIQGVEEGSPAEAAGLVKGDVVRKFDGITVASIDDIRENLEYYNAGETVELIVYRIIDGQYIEKKMNIVLGSREGTPLDPELEGAQNEESDAEEAEEDHNSDEEGNDEPSGNFEYNFGGSPEEFFDFFNQFFNY